MQKCRRGHYPKIAQSSRLKAQRKLKTVAFSFELLGPRYTNDLDRMIWEEYMNSKGTMAFRAEIADEPGYRQLVHIMTRTKATPKQANELRKAWDVLGDTPALYRFYYQETEEYVKTAIKLGYTREEGINNAISYFRKLADELEKMTKVDDDALDRVSKTYRDTDILGFHDTLDDYERAAEHFKEKAARRERALESPTKPAPQRRILRELRSYLSEETDEDKKDQWRFLLKVFDQKLAPAVLEDLRKIWREKKAVGDGLKAQRLLRDALIAIYRRHDLEAQREDRVQGEDDRMADIPRVMCSEAFV